MKISDFYVGQNASLSKKFVIDDIKAFSQLSLDYNPVHLDEDYAQNSIFGDRIVHGFLTASLFSGIIGSILPGSGAIYLNQNLNFRKPIYHNELITAICTITHIREDKPIITLETICKNEKGEIAIDGTAVIKLLES
jgi:acyl dehydratase